jgi:hypothetical protein
MGGGCRGARSAPERSGLRRPGARVHGTTGNTTNGRRRGLRPFVARGGDAPSQASPGEESNCGVFDANGILGPTRFTLRHRPRDRYGTRITAEGREPQRMLPGERGRDPTGVTGRWELLRRQGATGCARTSEQENVAPGPPVVESHGAIVIPGRYSAPAVHGQPCCRHIAHRQCGVRDRSPAGAPEVDPQLIAWCVRISITALGRSRASRSNRGSGIGPGGRFGPTSTVVVP